MHFHASTRRGRYLREANVRRVNSPAAVSKQAAVHRQPQAAELVLGALERILREKAVDATWRRTGRRNWVKRVHASALLLHPQATLPASLDEPQKWKKTKTKQKDDPAVARHNRKPFGLKPARYVDQVTIHLRAISCFFAVSGHWSQPPFPPGLHIPAGAAPRNTHILRHSDGC